MIDLISDKNIFSALFAKQWTVVHLRSDLKQLKMSNTKIRFLESTNRIILISSWLIGNWILGHIHYFSLKSKQPSWNICLLVFIKWSNSDDNVILLQLLQYMQFFFKSQNQYGKISIWIFTSYDPHVAETCLVFSCRATLYLTCSVWLFV